jgi:hypothetical protein
MQKWMPKNLKHIYERRFFPFWYDVSGAFLAKNFQKVVKCFTFFIDRGTRKAEFDVDFK